jgi:O-antigen/teichoic acid export membrane protein
MTSGELPQGAPAQAAQADELTDPDLLATPADPLSDEGVAGRMVRGGAVRAAGFVGTNVLAAAGTILLVRHLGVSDFGRYGTVMALMTILIGVTDGGMTTIGARELSLAPRDQRHALTGVILGIRLVLTTAGVVVAALFALIAGYDRDMVLGTLLAGVGAVGIAAQSAMALPAVAELRNAALSVVELGKAAIQSLAIVVVVLAGGGVLSALSVQVLVGLGIVAALPLILGRGTLVRPRHDAAEWRHILRIALPVAIASVLAVLYLRIVVVIGSLIIDEHQTGLLVTSARIVEVASGLALLLNAVSLPVASVAARDDPDRLRYVAQRLIEVGLLLGTFAALAFGFGAPIWILLLGGHDYADAAGVLSIQGLVMITIFVTQACVVILVATHRQASIARANVVGLALIVVASLVLLPIDGARGGAIAVVVADVGLATMMLAMVRRAGVPLKPGLAPRIAAAGAVAVAAGLIPGLSDLASTAAALAAFVVAALALKAVPGEVLDAIPGLEARRAPRVGP